ncbi:hypothetical protein EZS27_012617 [termite gut metagenome]|jgi:transcriptional regulator with XRE-family HTH domain|uniref:HTH cro/C1-type domain-containing protein n=1 Tax=termite gut metagenome TaxID=433724 RepID=A0A5J4S2J5_9ZZZZ
METIYSYAIEIFRKKRNEKHISLQTVADYLNVSKTFICQVENPKQRAKLNLQHINELAKLFQCSPKDFLPESSI